MAEQVQKKGMSKGCLIALIVVGVLLLLIIIAAIVCYAKKDELARYGSAQLVTSVRTEMAKDPPPGIDTVRVNALADAFLAKMNETDLDFDKYGRFVQQIQSLPADEQIDSSEAVLFMEAMIEYFPELEELVPEPEEIDTLFDEDSLMYD